jgi:GT2 family glycosyltransferase
MIHYTSPYSIEKDIGKAYNQAMKHLNQDDWMCFTDADLMFLTSDYGHQIQDIVNLYPDTGLFTCLTNRIGNREQQYNNFINEDPNILNHRRIALQLQREKRTQVIETKIVISGMLFLIKKSTWDKIYGAPEGKGLLTVDNHIAKRVLQIGMKIRIMQGVYVFHFYRLDTNKDNVSHLAVNGEVTQTRYRRVRRAFNQ